MKRKTSSQSKKDGALQPSSISSEKSRRSQTNILQKGSGYVSRVPNAPVKKIPNVHSSLPGTTGHSSAPVNPGISRQLLQERQRNKILQEQSLCLSPGSLDLATNTAYVVDEVPMQFPNREGSMEREEDGTVKTLVGRMVEQKRTSNTFDNKKKVSPLKIIRGGNQFKVVDNKRSRGGSCDRDVLEKKPKSSGKVLPVAPQCLACSRCSKKFPLGGQWALERHVAAAHDEGEDSNDKNCCQYCDKKFIYESCLAAHRRWHVATNPWQCGNCDYKIDGLEKFVKHVRGVHGVNSVENARKLLVSSSY